VLHRIIWSWYTGRWWVGWYICYSEEGTGRGRSPPRPLLAVQNVSAHPSTASVPTTVLFNNGPFLCGFNVPIKGLTLPNCAAWTRCMANYHRRKPRRDGGTRPQEFGVTDANAVRPPDFDIFDQFCRLNGAMRSQSIMKCVLRGYTALYNDKWVWHFINSTI